MAGSRSLGFVRFLVPVCCLLLSPQAGLAQERAEGPSRAVVQALPPAEAAELAEALRRISGNASDVEALLTAGRASLKLGDNDAAVGFFTRARDLGTAGGRGSAGLASALVNRKMPVEALKLFAQAEAEGASPLSFASDYGLALDLVGDNARAQTYYRMVLDDHPDEDITRRLALSQAIGGDQTASEMTLLPLLQRQDLASYRARAFALAALGKTEEAVAIAEAIMPATLSARIAPYLRFMPRLTRAQQAAAANFGHFPAASAIGKDDPRIAEYAATLGTAAASAVTAATTTAATTPAATATAAVTTAIAKVDAPPAPVSTPAPSARAGDSLVPSGEPLGRVARPAAEPEPPRPSFSIGLTGDASGDNDAAGFDLAETGGGRTGPVLVPDAAPPAAPPAAPRQTASLSDAFADFGEPQERVLAAPGAVDVTAIEPKREEKPKPAAEPRKPLHPARVWVQVATGRDRAALGFDWRRIVRVGGDAMKNRNGYVARWGQTNRLVTGPFDNRQQAQTFVSTLKQAGIDSFVFASDEGEAVEQLPRR